MSDLSEKAIKSIKAKKKIILGKFANLEQYPSVEDPLTIFMAGSPGAGKTEYAKGFIENIEREEGVGVVHIDADEIKKEIPEYDGKNSEEVQAAASIGVEKLFDHVLKKTQNFVLDGTFAKYEKSRENIKRCIDPKRNRRVGIFYVYLEPEKAWVLTKKREKLEGRPIPKDAFISAFFAAKENVERIKEEFGAKVRVSLIIKENPSDVKKTPFEVAKIDSFIDKKYTREELKKIIDKVRL